MKTNSLFSNPQVAEIQTDFLRRVLFLQSAKIRASPWTIRQAATALAVPYRFADRVFALNASVSRSRGGSLETSASRRWCAAWATSSTARLNASSFARDGLVNPESFRTNCSDDARISSFVAGGEKLCRVLMARHMTDSQHSTINHQLFLRSGYCGRSSVIVSHGARSATNV